MSEFAICDDLPACDLAGSTGRVKPNQEGNMSFATFLSI
jgi:hypothetical protein